MCRSRYGADGADEARDDDFARPSTKVEGNTRNRNTYLASTFGCGLLTNNHRTGRGPFLGGRGTNRLLSRGGFPHCCVDGIAVERPTLFALGGGEMLMVVVVDGSTRVQDVDESLVHACRPGRPNDSRPNDDQSLTDERNRTTGEDGMGSLKQSDYFVSLGEGPACQSSSEYNPTLTFNCFEKVTRMGGTVQQYSPNPKLDRRRTIKMKRW